MKPKSTSAVLSTLPKIKINFEYNKEKVAFTSEPYKTLKSLKEKAIELIFPCPQNVKCYYLNKDISETEADQIGLIFVNKTNVDIKLREYDPNGINKTEETKPPIPKATKKIGNIKSFKKEEDIFEFKPESESNSKENSLNINSKSTKSDKGSKTESKEIGISTNDKEKESKLNTFKCSCKSTNLSIYCRECNLFLCPKCNDKEHSSHLTFFINKESLEESIKTYKQKVTEEMDQKDALNENVKGLLKKKGKKEVQEEKEDPVETANNTTMENLNALFERYELIKGTIKAMKKAKKIKVAEGDKFINDVGINRKKFSQSFDNSLNEIKKLKIQKGELKDFENYFGKINKAEKDYNGSKGSFEHFNLLNSYEVISCKMLKMFEEISGSIEKVTEQLDKVIEENGMEEEEGEEEGAAEGGNGEGAEETPKEKEVKEEEE
ncbi:MAG: B-box zinc finger protein [archaeon]|nr:B-box zinc finger protein [archaeon]